MSEEDYDDLRQRNVCERKAIFAELFKDIKKQANEIKELEKINDSENQLPKKRRHKISRIRPKFRRIYNTRSKKKSSDSDEFNNSENENEGNQPKLRVLFPWAKPIQRYIDLMKMGVCDVDEEEEKEIYNDNSSIENKRKRKAYKTNSIYNPESIPSVDEITQEMLNNVAEKTSLKTYCKIRGTSCHQCRQKTLDTKTVCRSGKCIGVRGYFCGPCLQGRYGESAVDALKDPVRLVFYHNWICPPCKGLCNCSICRSKSGLCPTGILAPIVGEAGFSSVMEYLQASEINGTQ